MNKPFRQSKYLNETGSKQGSWFLNRLDYFRFHYYPHYQLHRLLSLIIGVGAVFYGIKLFSEYFLLALLCWYVGYVALLTFNLLHNRICRYRGYWLYPKRFVAFFNSISKDDDLNDFDSIATQNQHLK